MRFTLKYFLLSVLAFGINIVSSGQKISVTLRVDLSQESVSPSGVHIAGDFQSITGLGNNWDPASTAMTLSGIANVYQITLKIPPGSYQYKYINGNAWGADENPPSDCSIGSTHNRQLTVGNTDLILPAVLFDSCNAMLNFSVDMSSQVVSADGVHVMGNFQVSAGYSANWDPSSIALPDLNHDGVYNLTLPVPPGQYEYLYVNGKTLPGAEVPPGNCSRTDTTGRISRFADANSGINNLPPFRFGSCDTITPGISTNYKTYWWNDAVFYEIFVRSFYDSNNDGKGDFRGIIDKLDYLNDGDSTTMSDLGITALWLMPMMQSPSYHGYDVIDYYTPNPDYGNMTDFKELITKAHAHGIKVIIDLVMNHTSDQNFWFIQSANKLGGFRNWYIWSDTDPGYLGPWGENVWNYRNGAYYYAQFYSGMPDLNYRSPEVKAEMFNVTNFWLGNGVDGFRLDAISGLIEDSTVQSNTPETLSFLEEFNRFYKLRNPDAFTVGEVWSNTPTIIPYVQNNRLDACFEFALAATIVGDVNNGNPSNIQNQLNIIQQAYPILQYATFLTNHDQNRVFSQLGMDVSKMKQAASLYLTMPGIPFIYYGEEVGMNGSGADEDKRRPMQWNAGPYSGFSTVTPWESVGTNYLTNNVETLSTDQNSIFENYKKLIHIRNAQASLRRGYLLNVNSTGNNILSYARIYNDEAIIVLSNFGSVSSNASFSLPVSSLPSGNYEVTELYSSLSMGNLTINSNGGIANWQSTGNSLGSRETWILKLSAKNPNSISSSALNGQCILLYPNPAIAYVQVKLDIPVEKDAVIEVYTVSGTRIYQSTITGNQTSIDVSDWTPGVYFVKVNVSGMSGMVRLVVMKQ